MKNFEDLTISDDYMFYHVMQNKDLCKTLLTSILSGKIAEITTIEIQKTFETPTNAKGIRLDVWIIDSTGKQYNIEMQTTTAICNEDRAIELDDGTTKILVNSSASNKVEDKDLRAFLEYMNGRETENDFVKSLKQQIETFKHNNRMREEYMYRMTVEDEIRHDALQEGMQQGMQQGREERNADIVLNMLSKGVEAQIISEYTKLSLSEIEKIRNKIQ